jgi:uracil-DNA glycosylase family 4
MKIVPAAGRVPNPILLIGEAPGKEEFNRGRPFVGKAGREQEAYLYRHNLSASSWRRTNVVCEYTEGNPDPTPQQIRYWTPKLMEEIVECEPQLIIAVGRFAARWFLEDSVDLEMVHGLYHKAGDFDSSRRDRGGKNDAVVIPIYHPAMGFYDNDARAVIDWDYQQVAAVVHRLNKGGNIDIPSDLYQGIEDYADVSGQEIADYVSNAEVLAIDTEGILNAITPGYSDSPWSIQVSKEEGEGYTLRYTADDFQLGINSIQSAADRGVRIILHNAMFDIEMCRAMGLELNRANIWDSMYAAYLLRLEPQGLKPLSWRWSRMRMKSYEDVVGDAGKRKQLEYLAKVIAHGGWQKTEKRDITYNDGTSKPYKPQNIVKRAEGILLDCYSDKRDKDGNPVDVLDRWTKIDNKLRLWSTSGEDDLRSEVESMLGPIPIGTLEDIPLDEAVRYASRDADATLRLYNALSQELDKRGINPQLMISGMEILPVFEEMQFNGMPASRKYFENLYVEMDVCMEELVHEISDKYYGGKPFNPKSPPKVAALLRRRGLEGTKRTKTGKMSTGKKSIEHLRYTDDAMSDIFDWREMQHIRDSFCKPAMRAIPIGEDYYPVRCNIKVTRTATRRLASKDPNLLAIPIRKDLGRRVREGYQVDPESGLVLGAWDHSQVELRAIAHDSKDRVLCNIFNTGRDPHTEAAVRIFGKKAEDIDKFNERLPAKTTNFGVIYGIQGDGLLTQFQMLGLTGWTKDRCDDFINEILDMFPDVRQYIEDSRIDAMKTGRVEDHWGMPRDIPGIWSTDKKVAAEAARIAVSHRIQGMAQGMIQNSIIWLKYVIRDMQDAGMDIRWNLQVHDEVIMTFEEGLWEVLNPIVLEGLTKHCGIRLRVPIEAEGAMDRTWGGLK